MGTARLELECCVLVYGRTYRLHAVFPGGLRCGCEADNKDKDQERHCRCKRREEIVAAVEGAMVCQIGAQSAPRMCPRCGFVLVIRADSSEDHREVEKDGKRISFTAVAHCSSTKKHLGGPVFLHSGHIEGIPPILSAPFTVVARPPRERHSNPQTPQTSHPPTPQMPLRFHQLQTAANSEPPTTVQAPMQAMPVNNGASSRCVAPMRQPEQHFPFILLDVPMLSRMFKLRFVVVRIFRVDEPSDMPNLHAYSIALQRALPLLQIANIDHDRHDRHQIISVLSAFDPGQIAMAYNFGLGFFSSLISRDKLRLVVNVNSWQ